MWRKTPESFLSEEVRLSAEELMLSNCGVGEDSRKSLGLQGDPTSYPQGNQSWIFIERTEADAEIPIFWLPDAKNWLIRKDPDAGKDWRQEEKGKTEWNGWMASLTQWAWVWKIDSLGRWWRMGKPGVLQSMGSQRVGPNWVNEQESSLVLFCYMKLQ